MTLPEQRILTTERWSHYQIGTHPEKLCRHKILYSATPNELDSKRIGGIAQPMPLTPKMGSVASREAHKVAPLPTHCLTQISLPDQ